ncbi:MAG TPA: creatininase family protein [bacterium]|nr:creatininase family protein [bacterium]HPN46131.1 creatininase family protein [bacterium]
MNRKIYFLLFLLSCSGTAFPEQPQVSDKCWRWELLKPADLQQALDTLPIVYMVVSPLEWHGDAMPFGTDPVIGAYIAESAWRKTGGVLIPTLYIGNETLYKDWTSQGLTDYWGLEWLTKEHNPGSLYLATLTFELVIREMLAGVEREGFKACVIVSGHAGVEYVRILEEFEQVSQQRPMKVIYSQLADINAPAGIDFPGDTGHADCSEFSILGAIDSTLVDKALFGKSSRDRKTGLDDKKADLIDYEKGQAYLDYRVERIVKTVERFLGEQK